MRKGGQATALLFVPSCELVMTSYAGVKRPRLFLDRAFVEVNYASTYWAVNYCFMESMSYQFVCVAKVEREFCFAFSASYFVQWVLGNFLLQDGNHFSSPSFVPLDTCIIS